MEDNEAHLTETEHRFWVELQRLTASHSAPPWVVPQNWCDGTMFARLTADRTHWGLVLEEGSVHGDEIHNQLFYFDEPTEYALHAEGSLEELAAAAADWFLNLPDDFQVPRTLPQRTSPT
ncbi:hypothetical protein [Phytomonospora endophytica]|uniref:Uncharacterized protein n=1 Tax=Phytomonospora endophytica TaxID=714109 RepID=A0A841FUU0_9ACTN|nr:hypothetical protein [Phytomonospora endophytica]MBB6036279.1 hypothetical protein [Phytomonospora endophytica]GIG67186.1 hypothetical protein Pen01_34810 [Phytomonospora endophytica]